MEEEILIPENEEVEAIETSEDIAVTKILFKRVGNKLYLANKGCHSLIGCIENIDSKYIIEGEYNTFDKENQAIDYLLNG